MIKTNKFQLLIFIILSLIFICSLFYYYFLLPDIVASHFNLSGEANGWTSKESFLIIMLFIFLIFSGIIFLSLYLIPKMPQSMISIPNKEFYLSNEHKEETFKIINSFMLLICNLTIILLIIGNFFVFNINLGTLKKLPVFFDYAVILYVLSLLVIILRIYFKFRKIPQYTSNSNLRG